MIRRFECRSFSTLTNLHVSCHRRQAANKQAVAHWAFTMAAKVGDGYAAFVGHKRRIMAGKPANAEIQR
jgi:hypothetical protein